MWRNWDPCALLLVMQNYVAIMETEWWFLKKLNIELHVIQQFHFWASTLKN